jgi:hypothetical protein
VVTIGAVNSMPRSWSPGGEGREAEDEANACLSPLSSVRNGSSSPEAADSPSTPLSSLSRGWLKGIVLAASPLCSLLLFLPSWDFIAFLCSLVLVSLAPTVEGERGNLRPMACPLETNLCQELPSYSLRPTFIFSGARPSPCLPLRGRHSSSVIDDPTLLQLQTAPPLLAGQLRSKFTDGAPPQSECVSARFCLAGYSLLPPLPSLPLVCPPRRSTSTTDVNEGCCEYARLLCLLFCAHCSCWTGVC